MSREIKSKSSILTSTSIDNKHMIAFSEGSHRYKWTCPCHKKASSVGTTTFLKAGYPTSQKLVNWMKNQTASALFTVLTIPTDLGYVPRKSIWPIFQDGLEDLFKEATKAHEKTSQHAADIGTLVHRYAELDSLGKKDEVLELVDQVKKLPDYAKIESGILKYKEWALQNKGKLVCAESLVASPTYHYCGKFDRLDSFEGRLILRDYKTSKGFYIDHFLQLACYAMAIQEWLGYNVDGYEVLRFGKEDGAFETLLIDDMPTKIALQAQVVRCRQTYDFRKLENDKRFE